MKDVIEGTLIEPGGRHYDKLRKPWLQVVDQHPGLIVDAASTHDVVAAVQYARAETLALGIMATGHGIAVACDGLLLRFNKMDSISIDVARNVAIVGPGVLSSDLLKAAQKHDLVYPAGQVGNVGVIGFALGGGIGWLARKLGAAAGSIVAADVVLADGSLVRADAAAHPDLLWALRGGGGNFGVVVSLEIALTRMANVIGGDIYYPSDRIGELLRLYRDWSSKLPDETSTIFRIVAVPPGFMTPHQISGKKVCMIGICHCDPQSGGAALDSLERFGKPLLNNVKERTVASMAGLEPASHLPGAPAYGQIELFKTLSDDAIDALERAADDLMPPLMQLEIQQLGGALVSAENYPDGAFQPSSAPYLLHIESPAAGVPMAEIEKATAAAFAALGDAYTGEKYYNFLRGDEQSRIEHAFGTEKFHRLREIKHRYDPDNFFHLNLNVAPATAAKQMDHV